MTLGISVSVTGGVATLTGSGFRPMRAVCINVSGAASFRQYIHPDKTGALNYVLSDATVAGVYTVRATQVGPGGEPVTTEFTI